MGDSMEEVKTILRSILTSEKAGIQLRYLDNEYRTLTGMRIPYRQLGFNTLEEYLYSIPDVVRLSRNAEGNLVVSVVVTESTAHVAEMVRGQKSAKPRPMAKKSYRRPPGSYNAGYRPNSLLTRLTQSRPPPASSGDRRRPGYELYHPPQQRGSLGTAAKAPLKSYGMSGQADGASNANQTTRSSFPSHQSQSTCQTPPRFQKLSPTSTSGRCSQSKDGDAWNKTEPTAAANSVATGQPSTIITFKESEEDKNSSWQKLDNSWSMGSFKHSTRSAAEFWEFDAVDSRKQSVTTSQTTAGGDAEAAPSVKAVLPAVSAEPAQPVATVTATKSLGWADRQGSSTTTSMTSSEIPKKPVSTIGTVPSVRPSKFTEGKATVKPDQPRFDPFRQSISLDAIPIPSPEHAAAAAVAAAAAAAVPGLLPSKTLPSPTLPSPAPKELGISLRSQEPTSTLLAHISPLLLSNSSTPSVQKTLVPAPSGPLSKPRSSSEEDEYEKPVKGEHFTVEDKDIPQTPNCLLVHAYARCEGLPYSYSTLQSRSKRNKDSPTWLATLRLGQRNFPSYPTEKATQDEAKEVAAARAVLELGLHQQAVTPVTPASTPDEVTVLVRRLTSIVLDKPHGILKEGFEPQYKEIYSEQLPGNWFEHLVKSNAVHIERGNPCIVYPVSVTKTKSTRTKCAPDQEPVKNGHSSDISTGSPTSSMGEPSIISEYVDVFISCVATTTKVYFRFVEYEEAYTKLLQEMTAFFTSGASSTKVANSPEVAKLYATCYHGRWLRVEPLRNAEEGKVECCFVDEGNSLPICEEDLWELPEHFAELAHQAVECELDGLAEYADCDGAVDILKELLLGKTLVANVLQREDPVSVILYDTWGPREINLNHAVFLSLMTPRLPERGCIGRCYMCHVTPTGTVWLQIMGPGLDTLENIMCAFEEFCKGADSMTDDPVTGRIYGCQSRSDSRFYRAVLVSPEPLPSGEFKVRLVDHGFEQRAYIAELRDVDSLGEFVLRLPSQAVSCQMRGLRKEDGFYWSADVAAQVSSLSGGPHAELLCRVTKPGTNEEETVVELFRRNEEGQLRSINNDVIETMKQTRCPGLH